MKAHLFDLSPKERTLFDRLSTPAKIQDFVNTLSINFERGGDTCMSPRDVISEKCAHCLEGALVAAALLWHHDQPPLLLDLKASSDDFDHVVALFKRGGKWGAISKTNHAVLRYREPVYKTIRELALSYFHEYFNDRGIKTLRSFSKPFNLKKYGTAWVTSEAALWDIGAALDDAPHFRIVSNAQASNLRCADPLEIAAGKLIDYRP